MRDETWRRATAATIHSKSEADSSDNPLSSAASWQFAACDVLLTCRDLSQMPARFVLQIRRHFQFASCPSAIRSGTFLTISSQPSQLAALGFDPIEQFELIGRLARLLKLHERFFQRFQPPFRLRGLTDPKLDEREIAFQVDTRFSIRQLSGRVRQQQVAPRQRLFENRLSRFQCGRLD